MSAGNVHRKQDMSEEMFVKSKTTTANTVTSKRNPMLLMKRHRKNVNKRSNQSTNAPLLETISALAVNSDQSDSDLSNYDEQETNDRPHLINCDFDDDDDDDEYDFSHSDQLNCDPNNFPNDNVSEFVNQEHYARQSKCSPQKVNSVPQYNRRGNINLLIDQLNIQQKQKSKSSNKTNVPLATQLPAGKCVRFNADVQITSVSPRMTSKFANNSPYVKVQVMDNDNCNRASSPSNTYDEVASVSPDSIIGNSIRQLSHNDGANVVMYQMTPGEYLPNEYIKQRANSIVKTKKKPTNWTNLGNMSTSSSATSISDNEQCQQQPQSVKMSPQAQYANIEMLQSNQSNQSKSNKDTTKSTTFYHSSTVTQQQQPPNSIQQKSILKDPLCAKLRSAVKKGQFVLTDTAKLESEIDILLHGNENLQRNCDFVTVSSTQSPNNSDTDILLSTITPNESNIVSTCDNLIDSLIQSVDLDVLSNCNRFNEKRNKLNANSMAELSCNSYVQMIEEKYRVKDNSGCDSFNQLVQSGTRNSCKQSSNKTKQSNGSKKGGKSKMQNIDDKAGQQYNGSNRKSSTNGNFLKSTDQMQRIKHSVFETYDGAHPVAPLFTTNMDQLMSTLMHESDQKQKSPDDLISKGGKSQKRISNTINMANEKLLNLFADPVKGPCINLLMDELYRLPSQNQQNNSDTESIKSGSNQSTYHTRSIAENHIYEEILYECLENQQNQDQVDLNFMKNCNDYQTSIAIDPNLNELDKFTNSVHHNK